MPYFQKTLAELQNLQDKWLYIFKHLHELDEIPTVLQEAIFIKLFEAAQIAQFSPIEQQAYEDSLKYYRDLKNITDTARDEGEQIGEQKGFKTAVLAMYNKGLPVEFIAQTLDIPIAEIQQLIEK